MIVQRLLVSFIFAMLVIGQATADTLSKTEFTNEMNAVRAMNDFDKTVGFAELLEHPDLSPAQHAYVFDHLNYQKQSKGDDKLGALEGYRAYMAQYPDKVTDTFYDDFDFFLTQTDHLLKRAIQHSRVEEQIIQDIWDLGHWDDAVALAKSNPGIRPRSYLIEDFIRSGYLCEALEGASPLYLRSINNTKQKLTFCAPGTQKFHESPQPFLGENLKNELHRTRRLMQEYRAELNVERYTK